MPYSLNVFGVYFLGYSAPGTTDPTYSDWLVVDPSNDHPYKLVRAVTRQEAERILATRDCSLQSSERKKPKGHKKPKPCVTTVDDVDALLAGAGTVPEPRAAELLARVAGSDAWHRYDQWRNCPGHRAICPQCNTAFMRDRHRGRRCLSCRAKRVQ